MSLTINLSCSNTKNIAMSLFNFSQTHVNSFGLWGNSCFKIFVKNDADTLKLQQHLTTLNQAFFKKYQLKFEIKKCR